MTRFGLTGISVALFAGMVTNAAFAQQNNDAGSAIVRGIFGIFGRAAAISRAKEGWLQIEPQTQGCVAAKTHVQPTVMMNNGVGPDDQRVAPYIEACRREAEEANEREAQAAAAKAAQDEAEKKALEEARLVKAAQDARHRTFVAKYGSENATAIESGQVRMGMTKDEVLAARGAPPRKDAVPPDYELWHYASGDIAFDKGHVSYVGH